LAYLQKIGHSLSRKQYLHPDKGYVSGQPLLGGNARRSHPVAAQSAAAPALLRLSADHTHGNAVPPGIRTGVNRTGPNIRLSGPRSSNLALMACKGSSRQGRVPRTHTVLTSGMADPLYWDSNKDGSRDSTFLAPVGRTTCSQKHR